MVGMAEMATPAMHNFASRRTLRGLHRRSTAESPRKSGGATKPCVRNWLEPLGPALLPRLKKYLDAQRAVYDNQLPFDLWLDVLAHGDLFEQLSEACHRLPDERLDEYLARMFEALDAGFFPKLVSVRELASILHEWARIRTLLSCEDYEPAFLSEDDDATDQSEEFAEEEEKSQDNRCHVQQRETAEDIANGADADDWSDDDDDDDNADDGEENLIEQMLELLFDEQVDTDWSGYEPDLDSFQSFPDHNHHATHQKLGNLESLGLLPFQCWEKDSFLNEFERQINNAPDFEGDSVTLDCRMCCSCAR